MVGYFSPPLDREYVSLWAGTQFKLQVQVPRHVIWPQKRLLGVAGGASFCPPMH